MMDRVNVVGTSGSGKSTFARQLAEALGQSYVQLDALYWGPDWMPVPEEKFIGSIRRAVVADRWVVDGNYSRHRELIWSRASHVIWLVFSFPIVMYQLFFRTMRRSLMGEELFSGNRESLVKAFFRRDSILLWGLTTFRRRRGEYRRIIRERRYPSIEIIVLSSPHQAHRFLERLQRTSS
ncbi:MAG: toxin [Anaerolineales bacterium]